MNKFRVYIEILVLDSCGFVGGLSCSSSKKFLLKKYFYVIVKNSLRFNTVYNFYKERKRKLYSTLKLEEI